VKEKINRGFSSKKPKKKSDLSKALKDNLLRRKRAKKVKSSEISKN